MSSENLDIDELIPSSKLLRLLIIITKYTAKYKKITCGIVSKNYEILYNIYFLSSLVLISSLHIL